MNSSQKTKNIHISVLSADLKLIGIENRRELHLSCDLINIARGNCNIILRQESNKFEGFVYISADRPIMNSEIKVAPVIFDQVQSSLKHNTGRPLQLILMLDKELTVDIQGVLTINHSINAKIIDISWILPIR